MAINPSNIQEHLSNTVINYLKERDEKMLLYEQILACYRVEVCAVCKEYIGIVSRVEGTIQPYDDNPRRCWNSIDDKKCETVVCKTCDDKYLYPWHIGNSWFGIPPRSINPDDYICMICANVDSNDQLKYLKEALDLVGGGAHCLSKRKVL